MSDETKWFLPGPGEEDIGPLGFDEILARWKRSEIDAGTECWHAGMDAWRPLQDIEEFKAFLEKRRREVRSQWIRRGGIAAAAALLLGAAIGIGMAVRGPAAVRQAERLVESSLYADAGRAVGVYAHAHPDHARAAYLLGLAALGDYACGQAAPTSADPLKNAQVDAARTHLLRAERLDPSLKIRLTEDLRALAGQVSPSAAQPCARLYAVNGLRAELGGESTAELVRSLVELAVRANELGNEAGLSNLIVQRLLKWNPASAGAVFAATAPRNLRSGYEWTAFLAPYLEACREQADAKEPLGRALLDYADARAGGGDPNLVDQILRTSVELCPALAGDAAEHRLRHVAADIASGNAAEALRKLERLQAESTDHEARIGQLYFDTATSLGGTDAITAGRAMDRAFELDPSLLTSEDRLLTAIRSLPAADESRLSRIRTYLGTFPDSAHAPELRTMMLKDASVLLQQRDFSRRDTAPLVIQSAQAEALRLLEENPGQPETEASVFDLVMQLGSRVSQSRDPDLQERGLAQVITLADRFLGAYPDSPRRPDLELAKDTWRKQEGRGTLPEDLDSLMDRVDKGLRILILASPGAVNLLAQNPDAYHVVQVPHSCGKDRFNSAQAATLRQWVNNGGVLWASGNVLDLFSISYQAGNGNRVCTANPGVSPVNTDCAEVLLNIQYGEVVNLHADGVIPLLVDPRGVATWSLVPFGRGWISDAKQVDVTRYDGARFWLNLRLFCMGEAVPGSSVGMSAVHRPASGEMNPPVTPLPETEPILLSDEERAVIGICTNLARQPNDAAQLAVLKGKIVSPSGLEHRDRYLAIYYLGSLNARQAADARQAFNEMKRAHPDSAYAAMISPDRFMTTCPACNGSTHSEMTCPACQGNGGSRCVHCGGKGSIVQKFGRGTAKVCPHCSGTGRTRCTTCQNTGTITHTCTQCRGRGHVYSAETVRNRYLDLLHEAARAQ